MSPQALKCSGGLLGDGGIAAPGSFAQMLPGICGVAL
jgi:hypothetical protein